ncbi:hypothetical protein ACFFX1_55230 [Dactylosporangium sucinum]
MLVLLGVAIGAAAGYNLGQRSRPRVQQLQAADAVVRFVRAVEASEMPRESVMAVKHVVSETYDAETAAYIHTKLRNVQAGNE